MVLNICVIQCLGVSENVSFFLNPGPTLTDGRFYQWQLCNGNSWMDIENDHVIEAQYTLPTIRSLKLYNLPFG